MRASLFLSALLVATLAGGIASAEKPDKHAKEPRVTNLRSRGDMVDGSGRHLDRTARGDRTVVQKVGKVEAATMLKNRAAAERVRCSEAQDDCGRGGSASSKKSDSAKDQAAKSDKKVATKDTASASQAAKAAVLMKLTNAKCGARSRGGCSGHDDPR